MKLIVRRFGEDQPILAAWPEQIRVKSRSPTEAGLLHWEKSYRGLLVVMMMVVPVVVILRLCGQSDTRYDGQCDERQEKLFHGVTSPV
jgi:hypothetical protein